jgi:hypothetical protein
MSGDVPNRVLCPFNEGTIRIHPEEIPMNTISKQLPTSAMPVIWILAALLLTACGGGDDPTASGAAVDPPHPLLFQYLNRLPQPTTSLRCPNLTGMATLISPPFPQG